MKNIIVRTKLKEYKIFIKPNLTEDFEQIIKNNFRNIDKIAFISNDKIYGIYERQLHKHLSACGLPVEIIIIQDGEKYKSLESVQVIYEKLISSNFHRNDLLIAFGGGVIGDLAGFAASTFHRGLKLLQYPTTIIGQVDSSIGGKVVVNFKNIKNVIGSFYQPDMVMIDTDLLNTLDVKQIINGLAEIVKYGIVFDRNILSALSKNIEKEDSLEKIDYFVKYSNTEKKENTKKEKTEELFDLMQDTDFPDLIQRCCEIKVKVVEKDEFDTGYRNLLNFGHTIGHAIEKVTNLADINHGMAVSLGMIAAIDISISLGLAKKNLKDTTIELFKKLKLPYIIPNLNIGELISALQYDKKFTGTGNRFVLLKDINKPVFVSNVEENIIIESIEKNMTGEIS